MGKERFYWGGSGSRSTERGRSSGGEKGSSTTPGCMCAVLQLFDFHQFQFAVHDQQLPLDPDNFPPEEPTVLKGVEAPRNSLELEEPFMAATCSSSSAMKEQQNLNIPVGIQIKTSGCSTVSASRARTDDLSLEFSSSPGTKTPNLVARLMGLDLLPESSFPSLSSTSNPLPKSHLHPRVQNLKQEYQSRQMLQCRSSGNRSLFDAEITGTRSLPETPRISSARRSDIDHRLSVQINKENVSVSEEFEFSSYSTPRTARRRELKQEDENRSQSNYGRQIVKQVRESVSRRVGLDITNTTKKQRRSKRSACSSTEIKESIKGYFNKIINRG
ncbi:hypothetical protein F0562_031311 [Nyssa sinensis]|uniref:DUF3741 domain-containing protein n=1 Tax=Nyssa sinensis TaxID=561372 RepID=A0A5J5AU45_9ASTE|nr:hypothetical protein F0562_031311 [Nyssa sinensis]